MQAANARVGVVEERRRPYFQHASKLVRLVIGLLGA